MIQKVGIFKVLVVLGILMSGSYVSVKANLKITNILKDQYNGYSKNWAIDFNNKGVVYVCNEAGLLEFDGKKWRLYKLPGNETVRSVLVDGDRVYTGSFEQFGYWEPDATGGLCYTSLID